MTPALSWLPRRFRVLVLAGALVAAGATWATACQVDSATSSPPPPSGEASASDAATDQSDVDAGEDVNAPPGTYAKLIASDEIWTVVPTVGSGGVTLHEARVAPDPFPRRRWTSCGAGCRVSPSSLPFDVRQYLGSTAQAGAHVGNEGYLLLHAETTKDLTAQLTRLERLSDGSTVAAVLARGQISAGRLLFRGGSAAFVLAFGDGNAGNIRFARASPDGAPLQWQPSWRTDIPLIATARFGIGESIGLATYGGSLLFATPTSQDPIDLQPGTVFAHGQNGQLLFGYSNATIQSFTLAGGVTPFITLPAGRLVVGVQTSAERIVWIDGVRAGDGWSDLRWHWSPLVVTPAGVVVHDGPSFPVDARAAPWDLHTTGDWAITEVGIGPENVPLPRFVIAWNIATGAMHVVPERPGKVLKRAFLLTPSEMILGYRDPTSFEDNLDELVGLQVSAIPDVVARWSAGKN